MKTGIIRRIDNLGRIVIPKAIRKDMKIKSGDSIEITENKDAIYLKKYSELENIESIGNIIIQLLKGLNNSDIYITTRDKIILSSKRNYIQNLPNKIITLIEKRNFYINDNRNIIVSPIVSSGDLYGSIIVKSNSAIKNIEIIKIMTELLSKYLED
ncbi:MAG: AbrB/MazE/SpoVT family DNA-binding domain-containing protein [Bacilli bacterium]|nr:AbrB/MazE/SpoVT family DNA-binding domain-containing protein [Bacilli bacterium]